LRTLAEEIALESHSIRAVETAGAPVSPDLPLTVIEPTEGGILPSLRGAYRYGGQIWRSRELLYFMTLRDVKVRYKQTSIGVLWIILQPLWTMILFTFVFSHVAKVNTGGIPYPLFAYSALLPWQLFSAGVSGGSLSIVGNAGVLSKIYFPRIILPLGKVIAPIVDFVVAFSILVVLMVWYRQAPGIGAFLLPAFLLLAMLTALGVALWLSMLNVRYRDVQAIVPFMLQVWLYLTPIAYTQSVFPKWMHPLIELNPMATVVKGFRWGLLQQPPHFGVTAALSILISIAVAFTGSIYFRRSERTFVDVV
jgi:lipopolysaccharide transport system permease protein